MDDFLQKLKKVIRIVLNGPAISQSDCKKAGPYQLAYSNIYLWYPHRNMIENKVVHALFGFPTFKKPLFRIQPIALLFHPLPHMENKGIYSILTFNLGNIFAYRWLRWRFGSRLCPDV